MNANRPGPLLQIDRRTAITWMMTAAATMGLSDRLTFGSPAVDANGYGPDPDMVKLYHPGDVWPLTLNHVQRRAVSALCDVIIPWDEGSPSASGVGVPDFIDEWISAPYPVQAADRPIVLKGLAWIDEEGKRRFDVIFAELKMEEQIAICDGICDQQRLRPEEQWVATFFKKFRDLTAGGYYTTPAGMTAIGYVGNVPLPEFSGPPLAALKHVGLLE